jgi:hypothetical protein
MRTPNAYFYLFIGLFHYVTPYLSLQRTTLLAFWHISIQDYNAMGRHSKKQRTASFSAFKILQESPNYIEKAEHDEKIVAQCNACSIIFSILISN